MSENLKLASEQNNKANRELVELEQFVRLSKYDKNKTYLDVAKVMERVIHAMVLLDVAIGNIIIECESNERYGRK